MKTTASQVGSLVSIQRNRAGLTQEELEGATGVDQVVISYIETGKPAPGSLSNTSIEKLFKRLDLDPKGPQANFVKWWRDQH